MMRANDPRIRQRINQISQNLESANETAQEGFYKFVQEYLAPCFASVGSGVRECCAPCFPSREVQLRRRRRGRAEFNFDFYDDWDNDDAGDGLLGWGNDELDRLLAGSGSSRRGGEQPRRQRKMSYGAARSAKRRSTLLPNERDDPTVIPKSSLLGFLERFPWRIGPREVKYRPSVADLQERPGRLSDDEHEYENQPLMEATDESDGVAEPGESSGGKNNGRNRSGTHSSRETSNSLSSRGDLILSDGEEDAVPLDDEFAVTLARRDSGFVVDDQQSGRPSGRRQTASGTTSRESRSTCRGKDRARRSAGTADIEIIHDAETPLIAELAKEEESARLEEESEVARKRHAARQLAVSQGLARGEEV
jgi:hypothetical protein